MTAPQKDELRGLDCWIRAAEIGSVEACNNIGVLHNSEGGYNVLPPNNERFVLFATAGALRGHIVARHAIGSFEYFQLHNHELGIRHWKIAAEAGNQASLDKLKAIFIPKENYLGTNSSPRMNLITYIEVATLLKRRLRARGGRNISTKVYNKN